MLLIVRDIYRLHLIAWLLVNVYFAEEELHLRTELIELLFHGHHATLLGVVGIVGLAVEAWRHLLEAVTGCIEA